MRDFCYCRSERERDLLKSHSTQQEELLTCNQLKISKVKRPKSCKPNWLNYQYGFISEIEAHNYGWIIKKLTKVDGQMQKD